MAADRQHIPRLLSGIDVMVLMVTRLYGSVVDTRSQDDHSADRGYSGRSKGDR
jgi:hypothetical protein